MSKQQSAKQEQGYVARAPQNVCGNCVHYRSDVGPWDEKNMRCGLGGFAVRKLGVCNKHEGRPDL